MALHRAGVIARSMPACAFLTVSAAAGQRAQVGSTASKTLGAATELVTGFQNGDGSRWGRSVTAVPGPDGSIYLTDDGAGLVYRLTPAA